MLRLKWKRKARPRKFSEGELRRFEILTADPRAVAELDRVIEKKKLSRRDLGVITLFLRARPGFVPIDFGIQLHSNQEHL
jgi:hypothetical protein